MTWWIFEPVCGYCACLAEKKVKAFSQWVFLPWVCYPCGVFSRSPATLSYLRVSGPTF